MRIHIQTHTHTQAQKMQCDKQEPQQQQRISIASNNVIKPFSLLDLHFNVKMSAALPRECQVENNHHSSDGRTRTKWNANGIRFRKQAGLFPRGGKWTEVWRVSKGFQDFGEILNTKFVSIEFREQTFVMNRKFKCNQIKH